MIMALLTETIKYTYRENCKNNHKNMELRQKGKLILIPTNQTNKKIEIKIIYVYTYIHTYILHIYNSTLYERKRKSGINDI